MALAIVVLSIALVPAQLAAQSDRGQIPDSAAVRFYRSVIMAVRAQNPGHVWALNLRLGNAKCGTLCVDSATETFVSPSVASTLMREHVVDATCFTREPFCHEQGMVTVLLGNAEFNGTDRAGLEIVVFQPSATRNDWTYWRAELRRNAGDWSVVDLKIIGMT